MLIYVAAHSPATARDLAWLLEAWPRARRGCAALETATLIVAGADAWRGAVDAHCARERAASAADDDDAPASLEAAAKLRRADAGASRAAGGCSAAWAPLAAAAAPAADAPAPPSALLDERAALGALARAARVVLAPGASPAETASTACFLAIEHGLPVVAPSNGTCGGLTLAGGATVVATGNAASPVVPYGDFGAAVADAFCDGGAWATRAHAALELGLLLSSHADWADDPRLRGLLTGDAGADCGRDARGTRGRRDAALDASLLDALRLAVRLDDAGAPWGEA